MKKLVLSLIAGLLCCSFAHANLDYKAKYNTKLGLEYPISIKFEPKVTVYEIADDCDISIDGVKGTVSDLKENMDLIFTLDKKSSKITKIIATTPKK